MANCPKVCDHSFMESQGGFFLYCCKCGQTVALQPEFVSNHESSISVSSSSFQSPSVETSSSNRRSRDSSSATDRTLHALFNANANSSKLRRLDVSTSSADSKVICN